MIAFNWKKNKKKRQNKKDIGYTIKTQQASTRKSKRNEK